MRLFGACYLSTTLPLMYIDLVFLYLFVLIRPTNKRNRMGEGARISADNREFNTDIQLSCVSPGMQRHVYTQFELLLI